MSKFLLITKINLLSIFNSTKNNNSKYKSERRKKSLKILAVTGIVGYIMIYVFLLTKSLLPSFMTIGKPLYVIAFLFVICTIYIFFSNLFRIKNILFDFKDYDLLMSLPIKRSIIITSKIVSLYIVNLLYTLIVMLPGYIAYIMKANMPYDIIFFLLLLTIPIIPILASSIIGIILAWITSFFRNKNIGSYVVNLLIIFIVLFISFRTSTLDETEMVNHSINMVNSFGKYYPFTTVFVSLLENINLLGLLIYFLLPILLMILFILFINVGYIPLRNKLLRQNVKTNYEIKEYKNNSPLKRLYLKEIKKYFSNSIYVINTAFPCIMLIVLVFLMLISGSSLFSKISNIGNLKEMVNSNAFMILSIVCALSSTTHPSISLEGKSLWIMKTIPVSPSTIFLSKILVNFTVLVPTIIIGGTILGIYLRLSLIEFIFIYLLPFTFAVFSSVIGLLFNLLFPKFDFDNEIRVIKQSLPVFLTMLVGIIIVIVPFTIFDKEPLLITSIMVLIDIILIITLHYYGERKFYKL